MTSPRPPRTWTVRDVLSALRAPIPSETREHLADLWAALPESLRVPEQRIGRHAEGCGATIGLEPTCDFACTGCYLGRDANRTPPVSRAEALEELRLLRAHLGPKGNLQLTDGELTLRPTEELVRIVRDARELGLMPMLMTHGDAFRLDPGLLERLMVEGGLEEVSIHVDTTQRGRSGSFRDARIEPELEPLRDEFAEIVRTARARTRRPLRAASTVTVTADNLVDVPGLVRGFLARADAFRILSFQPLARVGRTRPELGGAPEVTALWRAIAAGLFDDAGRASELESARSVFGHPACTRVVMGLVHVRRGAPPRYFPMRSAGEPLLDRIEEEFLERFGGLSLRGDARPVALARALGAFARAPVWFVRRAPAFARAWARRLDPERPGRALRELLTGRARLNGLALVSHHFMDAAELDSPLGREREAACAFRVPIDGELVSMCRVNAHGERERLYARLALRARHERTPADDPVATP